MNNSLEVSNFNGIAEAAAWERMAEAARRAREEMDAWAKGECSCVGYC